MDDREDVEVYAILVLSGLPRLQTGSILAHELMHAYLSMAILSKLPAQVAEGLCQLLAYLWIICQKAAVRFLLARNTVYRDGRLWFKSPERRQLPMQ